MFKTYKEMYPEGTWVHTEKGLRQIRGWGYQLLNCKVYVDGGIILADFKTGETAKIATEEEIFAHLI